MILPRGYPEVVERYHVEAMLGRTSAIAKDTLAIAERYGLDDAAERISWALDFLYDAERCVTGTTTPSSE